MTIMLNEDFLHAHIWWSYVSCFCSDSIRLHPWVWNMKSEDASEPRNHSTITRPRDRWTGEVIVSLQINVDEHEAHYSAKALSLSLSLSLSPQCRGAEGREDSHLHKQANAWPPEHVQHCAWDQRAKHRREFTWRKLLRTTAAPAPSTQRHPPAPTLRSS